MNFTDLAKSYVRTIVPAVVGAIIAWALHHGHDIHGYLPQITVAVTAVYYALARILEHYVSGNFGWLLGIPATPIYSSKVRQLTTTGHSIGTHTLRIQADATQALAVMSEIKAAAEQASKAVAGVNKEAKRRPKAQDGYGAVELLVVVLCVVVILVVAFRLL